MMKNSLSDVIPLVALNDLVIYIREEKSLPKVKKFTDEKVKEIELKVKGNKDL